MQAHATKINPGRFVETARKMVRTWEESIGLNRVSNSPRCFTISSSQFFKCDNWTPAHYDLKEQVEILVGFAKQRWHEWDKFAEIVEQVARMGNLTLYDKKLRYVKFHDLLRKFASDEIDKARARAEERSKDDKYPRSYAVMHLVDTAGGKIGWDEAEKLLLTTALAAGVEEVDMETRLADTYLEKREVRQ